jgi:imidazolonepropionase-like amidohydrolase
MRLAPPLASGFLLGVALFLPRDAHSQAPASAGTWALTNARIETVTKGTIEKGTIVIRDGIIEAVGANVTPPGDARVVDLTGRTVYPGFIDLTSSMGLATPPQPQGGFGGGGGGGGGGQNAGAPARNVGLDPGRVIANEVAPAAADIRAARDAGITSALVAPSRGAFRGLSALIPMRDDSSARYIVKAPVGMHMGFQGVAGRYPATLLGVIAYERQHLYDAQRHGLLMDRYKAGQRGVARPSYDADLDALVPVVRGQLPAFFAASNENEIRRAIDIAKEFDLKLTIVGATEAFRALDVVKTARPLVVSVDFPQAVEVTGWAYRGAQRRELNDSATRDAAVRKIVEANAATLNRSGVKFALAPGALKPNDFIANVHKAIAAGLPREVAVQALTIRAAEIAGVGDQLGSIETGKIANLVVADGPPLGDNTRIRTVFVDGVDYDVIPAAAARNGQRAGGGGGSRGGAGGGGGEMAQVAGTWTMTVNAPQGAMTATMTLTQTNDAIDGNMISELGTAAISEGRVSGRNVTWSASFQMNGERTTVNFEAEVDGNRMTGRLRAGEMGTMTFTAEKKP